LFEGRDQDFQNIKHGYKIYKSIVALRLMQVTQCYVFLLAILRNVDRLMTDPTHVFQFIERFTFQYSAVSKQAPNRIEKIYSKYAIEVENALSSAPDKKVSAKIQSIFSNLEKDLKDVAPSEQVFKESFAKLSYRNSDNVRRL